MLRTKILNFKPAMLVLACILLSPLICTPVSADTPEQQEQYRYALGLVQRHLYQEAARILNRILSDPRQFSHTDGALFWLAECEYRQNNYLKAVGYYTQLLKEFPASIFRDRAAYGLGWAHTKDNNPRSAVEAYGLVSKNDRPLWIDANFKSGFLMVRYNFDSHQTVRLYEELLKEPSLTDAQKFEAHLQAGIGKFNQSIFAQALDHFNSAREHCPPDKLQALIFYCAESHFRMKNYREASSEYAKVIAQNPANELAQKASYSLAWCHINLNEPDKARPLFEKQAKTENSVVRNDSLKNLIELLMNLHRYAETIEWISLGSKILPTEDRAHMAYLKGLALSRIGEFEKSLEAFDTFIKQFTDNSNRDEAIYQKGLVLVALARYQHAIKEFEQISSAKTNPDIRERAIYRIGECYFNLGNVKMASEHFNRVITSFPKGKARFDALYQLGELAYMQENHADALTAFSAITATKSELAPQALFRSGEVLMRAGRFNDAIDHFQRYLKENPNGQLREDAIFKTGLSWLELKDQGQALAAFSQLLDATGYFRQEARFQIAEISRQLANYPLAIQHYKAVIAEEPTHPLASRVRRAIGICLYHTSDFAAAIEEFKGVLKDYPATDAAIPESRFWLGKSLIANDDVDNGILEILKVPVLHPKVDFVADAYAEAARAYMKIDNIRRARMMWEEVLKSSPSQALKDEANTALNRN